MSAPHHSKPRHKEDETRFITWFPLTRMEALWHALFMISIDTACSEDFKKLLGQPFTVDEGLPGSAILTVYKVTTLGHKRPDATRHPFSIEFLGPPGLRLEQRIHRFRHETAGTFDIFITQVEDGPRGSLFEAIFT